LSPFFGYQTTGRTQYKGKDISLPEQIAVREYLIEGMQSFFIMLILFE